jgi:hypothetical protein
MPPKYTPFYCEENIWHLCGDPRFATCPSKVVIISNESRACTLWAQRAAPLAGAPVTWDYHVILIAKRSLQWKVWDLDTTLDVPVELPSYLSVTFPPELRAQTARERLAPRFRIIEAETYRRTFSSDRSHMHDTDGRWHQKPPPWPPIVREGRPSFLRWTMMHEDDHGVASLDGFEHRFSRDS